jgi:excisionase family DNA binding protein
MPDIAEFMTTQEAAQALGFHVGSIQNMLRAGKLEGQRIGGKVWLVSRKSVERYKKQSEGMSKFDPRRGQN